MRDDPWAEFNPTKIAADDPWAEFNPTNTLQRKPTIRDRALSKAIGAEKFNEQYGQLGPQRNMPGVYSTSGPVPSVNQGYFKEGAVGSGMFQAGADIGSVISRVVPLGASGDAFQHAAADVDAARQAAGEGAVENFVRGGVRSLMPMAMGAKVKVPGLPAATGPIALGSAIQGSQSLTEARDQGLPEGEARAFAARSAAVEAASELVFSRFLPTAEKVISGGVKPSVGTLRRFAGEIAKTAVSEYGQEAATEYLHSANEWLSKVNPEQHEWTREGLLTLAQRMNQAGMQGAFLGGGIGAAEAGISAAERSNRFVDVTAERAARQQERAGRLAQLKELRDAKPFVSAEDGQKFGIPGETRKERLTNADAEMQQLEQEILNASAVPGPQVEVRQPESGQDLRGQGQNQAPAEQAGEVPQVRVEPPAQLLGPSVGGHLFNPPQSAAAPQAEVSEPPPKPGMVRVYHSGSGGEGPRWVSTNRDYAANYRPDLPLHYLDIPANDPRVNNQDYPEQGAKQGFTFNFELPANEAKHLSQIERPATAEAPPPDERQAMLDALGAAEAAAPEQPKRDVSAEIRDALAQGPVTVSTPQVQSGFKISKVREDGKVVTKHGKIITPDETWIVNPPKPPAVAPETPASPTQPGKEVPNGQKQEEGQGRKGLLTQPPQIEPAAAGEVPIAAPVAASVQPVAPPKSLGRKEQAAKPTGTPWREAVDSEADVFTKGNMLEHVAIKSKADSDLSEILDRAAKLEGEIGGQSWRVARAVEVNPTASPELKKRAGALRDEWMAPGRDEPTAPEPTQPAAEKPVEPAVEAKPEPKAEPEKPKAEAPAPLPGLPPPLTHHRGPTTAEDKAYWENEKNEAATKRVAIEDSKAPMQKELEKTRRNAHKKRGTLQDQIREKDRALAVADKDFRAAQNKLAYARLEAIIDNPPSPEHAWAAHARLNDLLADEAQMEGDYKKKQKYRDIHDEAVLKLLPFAEAAVREAGLVDKQDVERAAHTAVDRFSSRPDDFKTIADAAPAGVEAVRRERMGGPAFAELDRARQQLLKYSAKTTDFSALSSKDLDDLTTELQTAVKDDANWREKTAELFKAAKEKNADLEKKATEEKAEKAKVAAAEAEVAAAEKAKEDRERAKGASKEAVYWKSVKSRAKQVKGTQETVTLNLQKDPSNASNPTEEVEVPVERLSPTWAIADKPVWVDGKWVPSKSKLSGHETTYSLVHLPSGLNATSSSNPSKLKELWVHAKDAGVNMEAVKDSKDDENARALGKAVRAWDNERLYDYGDEAKAAILDKLPQSKPLPFEADVTLGAVDMGYGSNKEAPFLSGGRLKEFAASVPEFRYRPIFTVDSKKNLVFRDGYKFVFPAEAFNLGAGELTPGQTVAINLPEFGIQLATEQEVVAEMLRNHGMSNVKKSGSNVTASWHGKKVDVQQHGEHEWSAAGATLTTNPGYEAAKHANEIISRIRWVNPGTADAGPSKGKLGPSISPKESMQINEASLGQRSPKQEGKSSWQEGVEAMLPGIAADPKVAAAVKAIKDAPKVNDKGHPVPIDWKPLREAIVAAGYKGTDLTGFAADVEAYAAPVAVEPKKKATKKPTKLQQAADAAVQEAKEAEAELVKLVKKKGSQPTAMLDPEIALAAGKVVAKWVKAGTLKFSALVEQLAKSIGQAAVDRIRPALEAKWDEVHASGEYPGMEPRTPENQAEPVPMSGDDLTSIKKEVVNEMREMVGLPEMEGSTPQTVEEWAENARITLAADPKAAIRLVNELANSTRPITQNDVMLLQFRYRQLANQLAPVVDDYFEAVKSKDPVAITTAKSAVADARKAMTDFEETIHPSKETWGRTGVALQQMLRKDFSIEAVLRRGQEANDGEELTPDQTAELTAQAKKFQDLQKQFEAERKKNAELEAELASKRQHEEAVTTAKQEKVHRKSDKRVAAEKKVADAWEKFRHVMSVPSASGAAQIGAAVDIAKAYVELGYTQISEFMASVRKNMPDADKKLFREAWEQVTGTESVKVDQNDRVALSKLARDIQRELVEAGMTDREKVIDAVHEALQEEVPELTRRQTMDALSRYGIFQRQSQDQLEKLIRGMNSEILKLSQIDQMETAMKRVDELRAEGKTDEEIGKALDKEKLLVEATGLVRDRPSQTVRQLTQKYNELKKSIPATPSNKAGMLQTTLNQMERALKNRISDLNFEINRGEKVVKEKRERPTSDTIKALEAERDSLVKIHKDMFPPKKPSEAQRIASAIRGSDKAIAALEKQISTQDFDVEAKAKLSSPALDARRARLEQLKAHRKALKAMEVARMEGEGGKPTGKVPLSDAELARRAYESSLRSRIADYQELLAKGDFSPQPKKAPRTLTESELKLKRQMEDVRHEVLQKYADYHLAHLKGIAWGTDKIAEAAHLSRALMTSFDLSALLRQGGLAAMGHPEMAKNALIETVASIAHTFDSANAKALQGGINLENAKKFLATIDSRQAEFNLMAKLTEGPAGELRNKAGLNLPSTDQAITRQEEAFQGRWGKHVPGIALSSRLYTMILNKMRADLFDSMVQNLGTNGQVTMDEAKVIASFVNVATGRSDLKELNRKAATLNTVFFAPRYVVSRFQYLAMPFYLPFQGGLNANWRVKKAIYKEYGRTAVGIGTVLGAFALLGRLLFDDDDKDRPQIELDPRSSDFLKVRIGETRLDFMAGLSQAMVLSSRLASFGTKSSVTGNVKRFYKDRGPDGQPITHASVLGQFIRTKAAPVPGAIWTVASGMKNVVGQQETPASMAAGLFMPLSLTDASRTIESQGIPAGTAMGLLSTLGVGMTTYGPRTTYVTGTPEERQAQIEDDLKRMTWDSPEQPAYSEFLTNEQLEQFRQRRQEKRGLVVYNATYSGKDEDEIKTRDKNREHLDDMGVSKDEARQLLQDYYKTKEGGLRVKGGTGLKEGYVRKLRALNSIYGK